MQPFFIITSTDSCTSPTKICLFNYVYLIILPTQEEEQFLILIFGTFDPFRTFHPSLHESTQRNNPVKQVKLKQLKRRRIHVGMDELYQIVNTII